MVEALHINLIEIICAIINFLILFGVLFKFLYKPVLAMFEQRREYIKGQLEDAATAEQAAEEKLESYNQRLAKAEDEAREIVKDAKVKAEKEAELILDEARQQAESIKHRADEEVERAVAEARQQLQREMGAIAILAAEQILQHEVSQPEGQEKYINSLFEQAGRL